MNEKISKAGGVILRLAVYLVIAFIGLALFPQILVPFSGILVTSAIGTFLAAIVANAIVMRIFERAGLPSLGLNWIPGSARNLMLGLAGGTAAALIVWLIAVAGRMAEYTPTRNSSPSLPSALFVSVILLFGAFGEELFLRGYPFQLLVGKIGAFATILPTSLLFALMHLANPHVSPLGLINTVGFGVVLGYAMIRSGDLWMPSGIHFAWNWVLPLVGMNLSGFTMNVTGYVLKFHVAEWLSGGEYGPEASVLTTAVIVALVWYVHKAPVVQQKPLLFNPEPEF